MANKQVWVRAGAESLQNIIIDSKGDEPPLVVFHGVEIENKDDSSKEKADLFLVLPLPFFKKLIKTGRRELKRLKKLKQGWL